MPRGRVAVSVNVGDDKTVQDEFNNYFASIGVNLSSKIDPLLPHEVEKLEKARNDGLIDADSINKPLISFRKTNELEVLEIIKTIQIHKSSGILGVSSMILKVAFKSLVREVTHMINLTLERAEIPISWKTSVITPVYKVGDPGTPGNYRPISTLPLTAKLLEKCIHL